MNNSAKTLLFALIALLILFVSCGSPTSDDGEGSPVAINGMVVDGNEDPIADAIVRIISPIPEKTTTTNADGLYDFEVSVDSSQTYVIEARKEGYPTKTEEVLAIPDRDISMPDFVLAEGTGDDGSGDDGNTPPSDSEGSAFISLDNVSENEIRVDGAGGIETTDLRFVVVDSSGAPISDNNAVYVNFEILEGPGGGETIYPDSVLTNNGEATATLKSGTISGVVQVQASFTREQSAKTVTKTVDLADEEPKPDADFSPLDKKGSRTSPTSSFNKTTSSSTPTTQETVTHSSKPIQITIHGGLPSADHFTIKSEVQNMAMALGEENTITVDLGDKYGNDVPVGTMVQFKTEPDMGTITGAAETGEDGTASATLQTGEVAGISTVTAETINDNSQTITKEVDVLFSGTPEISIAPENVSLEDFTKQTFDLTVADQNNNPLAPGTSISVTVDNDTLALNGDTDITLGDEVQAGKGTTDFKVTLSNTTDAIITDDASLKIAVDGPNGSTTKSLLLGAAEAPDAPPINPGHITLAENGITNNEIGVINTGQTEQTELTFQVTDSTGQPLNSDNPTEVNFSLGSSPTGADIYPKTVTTDENGQATTTLTSGTDAGVAQVLAEITTVDGVSITSQPVQVAIHAGLPDQDHFTVKSFLNNEEINNVVANSATEVEVRAYAGDKYGNTVPEGTSIYFTTEGGYIYGSGQTDENGIATTILEVVNPTPGDGIATITASTANDQNQEITTTDDLMFSGGPSITVNPTTVNLSNDANTTFNYSVKDANDHPMTSGTTISVNVEGNDIEVIGDVDVTVGETNDSFTNLAELTDYQFNINDAAGDTTVTDPVQITITADGPNGITRTTISGTKAKTK